jgi:histidyl-tRNA synthetase
VKKELLEKGFVENDLQILEPIILLSGSNVEKIQSLKNILSTSEIGKTGIEELEIVFNYFKIFNLQKAKLILDITLARGLNYYTGAIFEVKTNEVSMGSIGGGGRYDDLTGMFGLKNLTGVGVSFGADRIYDVMEELNLFPENTIASSKVLITHFDEKAFNYSLPILQKIRNADISSELYPNISKMQKQMKYANDKKIPFVIVIGDEEMQTGLLNFKNMETGEQQKLTIEQILTQL